MKSTRASLAAMLVAGTGLLAALPAQAQGMRPVAASTAQTVKAYKVDAARHIYNTYPDRIYKGKLPPLVHAVLVLEMDLDASGNVRDINTIRVPTHAPDVTIAVKDMIRRASPLPAPARLGGAKFIEIWLVDDSGRFQLDTLTEGQR
ncbi:MAG TPA: hypothetical protein VJ743_13995 [Albitalea sp.]|nr:hypothetical protein [Albitalea sp.]